MKIVQLLTLSFIILACCACNNYKNRCCKSHFTCAHYAIDHPDIKNQTDENLE